MSKNLYSWEFDDGKERGALWYVIALSVVFGLTIWGFFTKQYGLSFITLFISGFTFYIENNSEDNIKVKISDSGIKVAGVFYNYSSIKLFGIVYNGEEPILLRLYLSKKGIREINVKIDNKNINEIRYILLDYIEETDKIEQTFSEKIIQLLKL